MDCVFRSLPRLSSPARRPAVGTTRTEPVRAWNSRDGGDRGSTPPAGSCTPAGLLPAPHRHSIEDSMEIQPRCHHFAGCGWISRLHPRHGKKQLNLTPCFHHRRGPAPLRPTARPAGSGPPHCRRVSPSRDRDPRAPSFPQGGRTTAATYGAGKMSPVGRRRPGCRPRCRSRCRCSAPPAGPPGSAGRAGGAPTMPRAPARHIHRPPLPAGPPHGAARSIAVRMIPSRAPRDLLTIFRGPLTDLLTAGPPDPGGSQGPSCLSSRPHGSWPGLAVEKPGPCVRLGFGIGASAAAAGPAIVYKRVRSQIFGTGRSERGVRPVLFRRMKFIEGRE